MHKTSIHRKNVAGDGFTIVGDIFSTDEIGAITRLIEQADQSNKRFRKSEDLFAIRQFLKEVSEVRCLIFNERLKCFSTRFRG